MMSRTKRHTAGSIPWLRRAPACRLSVLHNVSKQGVSSYGVMVKQSGFHDTVKMLGIVRDAETSAERALSRESATARNHASYSLLAMTTWIRRSLRTAAARRRSASARSRGQSSSASSRIRMRPSGPAWSAASSTWRSNLAGFENAVTPHPDRLGYIGKDPGGRHLGDPPDQDRDGLYLPVSLDDRDDRRHGFRDHHRTDRPGRATSGPNPAPAEADPSGGARPR